MSKLAKCLLCAGLAVAFWSAQLSFADLDIDACVTPQATVNSPASPSPTVKAAAELIAKGRLPEALADLDRLASEQPEAPGVERLRGFVLYQQNKLPESEAAFAKAIEQDGNDREAAQM